MAGDPAAAERILRPTFNRQRELGETGFFSGTAVLLAEAVYRQGRHKEALGLAEITRKAVQPGDVTVQAGWRQMQARVLAREASAEKQHASSERQSSLSI
jgi:hypothetical protein